MKIGWKTSGCEILCWVMRRFQETVATARQIEKAFEVWACSFSLLERRLCQTAVLIVSAIGITTAMISQPRSMRSFLKYWLPLLAWMAIIFAASSDAMSSEHTSRFLVPFLLWLKPGISPETIWWIQFFIRKAAHLIEYAILAMLLGRALYHRTNLQTRLPHLFASVWLAATLISAGDEFRQSFVPSREATWRDVLIDSGGAVLGLLIYSRWIRRKASGSNLKS